MGGGVFPRCHNPGIAEAHWFDKDDRFVEPDILRPEHLCSSSFADHLYILLRGQHARSILVEETLDFARRYALC
jgi:hypothetical protein